MVMFMSKTSFLDFLSSFSHIVGVVPIKDIENTILKYNLPLDRRSDFRQVFLSQEVRKGTENLPELYKQFYKAFHGKQYCLHICESLDKNLRGLKIALGAIQSNNQSDIRKKYGGKLKATDFKQFWETYYEIDALAYFNKIGQITAIEPSKKYSGRKSKSIDFHAILGDYKIHVEIISLSQKGIHHTIIKHYEHLNEAFKEVFDLPVTFDVHFFTNYQYSYHSSELLKNELDNRKDEVLYSLESQNNYKFIFEQGEKPLAEFRICIEDDHRGIRIYNLDEYTEYECQKDFSKIDDKYNITKDLYPEGMLNFLLVNILKSNPLFWSYDDIRSETLQIKEHIKKGMLELPRYRQIVNCFEKHMSKERDTNLTGIITYMLADQINGHSRQIRIYPNPASSLHVPKTLHNAIIS